MQSSSLSFTNHTTWLSDFDLRMIQAWGAQSHPATVSWPFYCVDTLSVCVDLCPRGPVSLWCLINDVTGDGSKQASRPWEGFNGFRSENDKKMILMLFQVWETCPGFVGQYHYLVLNPWLIYFLFDVINAMFFSSVRDSRDLIGNAFIVLGFSFLKMFTSLSKEIKSSQYEVRVDILAIYDWENYPI